MAVSSPRRRLPASERRSLIVDAALKEFATRGYEGASLGRIGRAAGVTRSVLYDHFPSKRALYAALLEDRQEQLMSHLREATLSGATMEVRMRATFDAFFRYAEEEPLAWRLLHPERAPDDPDAAADHRRCRSEAARQFAQMIAPDARRTGVDQRSPVGRAMFVLQQQGIQGAIRWWQDHPEISREEMTAAAVAALWDGLGGLEAAAT